MRIAYYEPEYFEPCSQLIMNYYNNEYCKCHFTDHKAQCYLTELTQTPRFIGFLILNNNDELLGAAFCHERTWWYKDELYINEFLIDNSQQSKGYGSKLLKFMQKHAKERDLAGITLITNNLAMAGFYQKNKFHNHDICFMYKGIQEIS